MIHAFRSDVEPNREQLESLIMRERERETLITRRTQRGALSRCPHPVRAVL